MADAKKHADIIEENFRQQAEAYLSSGVHAKGEDLALLAEIISRHPGASLLDLGCGGGHVAYAAAPLTREVTAYDLNERMLEVVARTARERGFDNIRTQKGTAEFLPFADAVFDIVASRYSAHHWHDVGKAVRETARVLKPGGLFALIDVASPGLPVAGVFLQAVELLRDTSHVRDYSPSEWLAFLEDAGLDLQEARTVKLRLEFASWVERMRTPEPLALAIRELQARAAEEVRRRFAIEADGSFTVDVLVLQAGKLA